MCKKQKATAYRKCKKENRNIYTVYKAINLINNKIYIGFTSKTIEERKLEHFYRSTHKTKFHFQYAINKYGFDNFVWEILYQSKFLDDALDKEKYFINKFNSKNNKIGYNIGSGGKVERLGVNVSEETKQKQSIAAKKRGACWSKKILAISNNTITEYKSIREAAKALNIAVTTISFIINGHKKYTKDGLTFREVQ